MKYCKDCKYGHKRITDEYYCYHEESIYNINSEYKTRVEGEKLIYTSCNDMRIYSICGENAILFKEKKGLIKRWLKNVFS